MSGKLGPMVQEQIPNKQHVGCNAKFLNSTFFYYYLGTCFCNKNLPKYSVINDQTEYS